MNSRPVVIKGLVQRGLVERSDQPGPRGELAASLTGPAVELLDGVQGRVAGIVNRMTEGPDAELLLQGTASSSAGMR